MEASIRSVATAAPDGVCTQDRAAAIAVGRCTFNERQATWLTTRFERSGARMRRSVLITADTGTAPYEAFFPPATGPEDRGPSTAARMREYARAAPGLGRRACVAAMRRAAVSPQEITHLVTVSCTGFMAPGLDTLLVQSLELPPGVGRAHLGFMGCHGAFNGMGVASAFCATRPDARVLLCAVELSSLHLHYGHDRGKIVANALFSDGASAFVIEPAAGEVSDHDPRWRVVDTSSCMLPDSLGEMTWVIGDHGFEMGLEPSVPYLIQHALRPWLETWLEGHGLSVRTVRSWAIHPGGPQVLDSIQGALEITPADTAVSRAVLAENGNMSSATLGFVLERMIAEDRPRPCVALGFGPGLMAEAALLL